MANPGEDRELLFSIILAFRNEAGYLGECLQSIDNQVLPRNEWEIILVDGQSNDGSGRIAKEYAENHGNTKYAVNPERLAAAGWNIGVDLSSGEYYFPASGHSTIEEDFLLEAKRFLNLNNDIYALGGRVTSVGVSPVSKAIAAASNTPFAFGGVYYRVGTAPKRVNVVGLGIYSRELYKSIGPYLGNFVRSGDWEFNYRAWIAGYKMYINPNMKSQLYVRSNFSKAFLQQFITGFWKIRVWEIHPRSLLLRHIIPLLFVLWILGTPFVILRGWNFAVIWIFPALIYLIASLISALKVRHQYDKLHLVLLAYPIIHIGYGLGMLAGLIDRGKRFLFRGKK